MVILGKKILISLKWKPKNVTKQCKWVGGVCGDYEEWICFSYVIILKVWNLCIQFIQSEFEFFVKATTFNFIAFMLAVENTEYLVSLAAKSFGDFSG